MNDHQVDHASIIAFADTLSMRTSHFFGEAHRSEMILADFLSLKSNRRSMIKEAPRRGTIEAPMTRWLWDALDSLAREPANRYGTGHGAH